MDGLSSVAGIAEVIGFYFAEFFCDVGLGDFHAAVAPVHGQNPSTYGGYLDLSFHVAVGIGMAVTSNSNCGLQVSFTTTAQPASGPDGVYASALQMLMVYSKRCYSLD